MTPRRFDWALRTRGPALDTWPAAERDAALELLRHDADARRALADAMVLEPLEPSDEATASDTEQAALRRMQLAVRRALAPSPPVVRGLGFGAMAACLAAGLYLGAAAAEADVASVVGPMTEANLSATVLAALDP